MKNQAKFTLATGIFALTGILGLSGCIEGGDGITDFAKPDGAILVLEINIGADTISGPIPTPNRLLVKLTSETGDVLWDTISPVKSVISRVPVQFDPLTPLPQIIRPEYNIRPLRAWKVDLELLNTADSVFLSGSAAVGRVAYGDTLRLAISLVSQ